MGRGIEKFKSKKGEGQEKRIHKLREIHVQEKENTRSNTHDEYTPERPCTQAHLCLVRCNLIRCGSGTSLAVLDARLLRRHWPTPSLIMTIRTCTSTKSGQKIKGGGECVRGSGDECMQVDAHPHTHPNQPPTQATRACTPQSHPCTQHEQGC